MEMGGLMEYEKRLTGFSIHGFAVAHAVAAAALAQTLVGDEVVLTTITISMILVIDRINKKVMKLEMLPMQLLHLL